MRLRLDIAYDGAGFHGWATQPGRRTVAGVLGEALATLFRGPVPMVVAGRTDAGVHATGQVAHIDVDPAAVVGLAPRHLVDRRALVARAAQEPTAGSAGRLAARAREGSQGVQWRAGFAGGDGRSAEFESGPAGQSPAGSSPDALAAGLTGLRRRLAGLLPTDVRVSAVRVAPAGFDARFSALRRHYRYRIAATEWGVPPLHRHDTLAWRRPLDVPAMQDAADRLLGLNDFAAFCKPREGSTTIRDLQLLTVTARSLARGGVPAPPDRAVGKAADKAADKAGADDAGALVVIDVTADAFCHSMVRSLVGALLAVGDGRLDTDRPAALLAAGRRTAQIATAPAHGLTLVRVDYPVGAELATRSAQTRALRELPSPPVPGS